MLTTIESYIQLQDGKKLNLNAGSLMHGALMELIDADYADYLHQNALHPFSQYIRYDKNRQSYVWRVSTLCEEAKSQIIDKVYDIDKIYLKNSDTVLKVTKQEITKTTYKELADKYMLQNSPQKKIVVKFLTPSTFKTGGEYIIFPEIRLIYSSLIKKWNTFSKEITLQDTDMQNHLITHTKIIGYKLRSTKFQMEQVAINAFMGDICLMVNAPLTLVSVANLLFEYSKYSGIGAKNSMGMGGIEIE